MNITEYLSLLPKAVSSNLEVVDTESINQNYMLHISPKKMDKSLYVPQISRRQAPMEDRRVPRITVAPTLYGCLLGHQTSVDQLIYYNPNNKEFKQG